MEKNGGVRLLWGNLRTLWCFRQREMNSPWGTQILYFAAILNSSFNKKNHWELPGNLLAAIFIFFCLLPPLQTVGWFTPRYIFPFKSFWGWMGEKCLGGRKGFILWRNYNVEWWPEVQWEYSFLYRMHRSWLTNVWKGCLNSAGNFYSISISCASLHTKHKGSTIEGGKQAALRRKEFFSLLFAHSD